MTGEEGEDGEDGKQTGNQRIWKHCCELPPLEADATPAMVIITSAKLIFRITVEPLELETGRWRWDAIGTVSKWQHWCSNVLSVITFQIQYVKQLSVLATIAAIGPTAVR